MTVIIGYRMSPHPLGSETDQPVMRWSLPSSQRTTAWSGISFLSWFLSINPPVSDFMDSFSLSWGPLQKHCGLCFFFITPCQLGHSVLAESLGSSTGNKSKGFQHLISLNIVKSCSSFNLDVHCKEAVGKPDFCWHYTYTCETFVICTYNDS